MWYYECDFKSNALRSQSSKKIKKGHTVQQYGLHDVVLSRNGSSLGNDMQALLYILIIYCIGLCFYGALIVVFI
jgi:hypothetical protein